MSELYHSTKYGMVDIAYVCTGGNCGYWIAKTQDGQFICTADSRLELTHELNREDG